MHKTFAAKNKETSSQTAGAASEKVSPFHVGAGGDRLPAGLTRTHNAKKSGAGYSLFQISYHQGDISAIRFLQTQRQTRKF